MTWSPNDSLRAIAVFITIPPDDRPKKKRGSMSGNARERHGLFRCGAFIAARGRRPSINVRISPPEHLRLLRCSTSHQVPSCALILSPPARRRCNDATGSRPKRLDNQGPQTSRSRHRGPPSRAKSSSSSNTRANLTLPVTSATAAFSRIADEASRQCGSILNANDYASPSSFAAQSSSREGARPQGVRRAPRPLAGAC